MYSRRCDLPETEAGIAGDICVPYFQECPGVTGQIPIDELNVEDLMTHLETRQPASYDFVEFGELK